MQCVRCGKVMNLEERRCPRCLASLSNQQIGQLEVTQHQLRELADVERADMRSRPARQGLATGALIGTLGMLLSMHPILIAAGGLTGAVVGWLVGWRKWGQMRTCFGYCAVMLPLVAILAFNPFTFLTTICMGMVLGVAIQLNEGR